MAENAWSSSSYPVRRDICEAGRRIYQRGYVAANDGNISARIGANRILCTPTGVSKGFISEDMLAVCDMEGKQVAGQLKISSEIYQLRGDIHAIVHAHPPTATGFAVAGIELTQCVLPEVIVNLGEIPLASYGTPGGPDIVEPMKPLLKDHDAVLMANHGVVTLGKDVLDAHFKMETVEHFARISLVAHQLNSVHTLDAQQVADLRQRFDINNRPSCDLGNTRVAAEAKLDESALIREITREVLHKLGQKD
jgi:L-fuculose-phosphate aldolase